MPLRYQASSTAFQRHRFVAVLVEPAHLAVEVGPGHVELGVGGVAGRRPEHVVLEDRHRAGVGLPAGLGGGVADERGRCFPVGLVLRARSARGLPAWTCFRESTLRRPRPRRRRPPPRLPAPRRPPSGVFATVAASPRGERGARPARRRATRCRAVRPSGEAIMVGNRPMATADQPQESLAEALDRVHPELAAVREVAAEPVYLVGGAVRDLLLGRGRADIDLVVEGDAAALASRLGAEVVSHERFATAKVGLDGHEVDIAAARSETYPHPGALPVVEPAAGVEADLARRDFTINAMAIPLRGEPRLIDPHGGRADLDAGLLRVLHPRLLRGRPDAGAPGRPLRGPLRLRAGARDGGADARGRPEHGLGRPPRRRAAAARRRRRGAARVRAARRVGLGRAARGRGRACRSRGRPDCLGAVEGPGAPRPRPAAVRPWGRPERSGRWPNRCPSALRRRWRWPLRAIRSSWFSPGRWEPSGSIVIWASGATSPWRSTASDLIAAGVLQGPAVGRGLGEALRRKLDGEIDGRDQELAVALEAARSDDGVA